jgi:hypothetical protein
LFCSCSFWLLVVFMPRSKFCSFWEGERPREPRLERPEVDQSNSNRIQIPFQNMSCSFGAMLLLRLHAFSCCQPAVKIASVRLWN